MDKARKNSPYLFERPRLLLPNNSWEPIFFGFNSDRQTICGRAKLSKLVDPRRVTLPSGDLEIRLWEGFGITYLQGYTLRKSGGRWTAALLTAALPRFAATNYLAAIPAPRPGWDRFWKAVVHEGILTLPDASTLKDDRNGSSIRDGMSYVVEINRDRVYRTYLYDNPDAHKWPEAKRMLKIARLFHEELRVPNIA